MEIYKIHLNDQGEIIHSRTIYGPNPDPEQGILVDKPVSIHTQYWDKNTGTIKNKTEMPCILESDDDTTIISGIPNPSTVFIDGNSTGNRYEITDGFLEVFFDTPGTHSIRIKSVPYLEKVIIIET